MNTQDGLATVYYRDALIDIVHRSLDIKINSLVLYSSQIAALITAPSSGSSLLSVRSGRRQQGGRRDERRGRRRKGRREHGSGGEGSCRCCRRGGRGGRRCRCCCRCCCCRCQCGTRCCHCSPAATAAVVLRRGLLGRCCAALWRGGDARATPRLSAPHARLQRLLRRNLLE